MHAYYKAGFAPKAGFFIIKSGITDSAKEVLSLFESILNFSESIKPALQQNTQMIKCLILLCVNVIHCLPKR